ncbi:hypothetical protein N9L47_09070 [Rhodobacteraceae bacterium]|nr:hypothetical protein [Paracoccaceae bacterium]
MKTKNPQVVSTVQKYTIDGFLLLSFLLVSLGVYYDYLAGGHNWKQGDWLINNSAGYVRRGPLGSAFISISDYIGSNPLLVVSVCQIIILAILFISFRLLVTQCNHPKLWLLILISPAIFTVFWVADPLGAVRKELIAFTGLSLYALGSIRENWLLLWAGVLVFCISVVSHEAMVLFIPTLFGIIILTELHKTATKHALTSAIVVTCLSIVAFIYAINTSQAVETYEICSALIERGLNELICRGAIEWLSYDSSHGFRFVVSMLNTRSIIDFLIIYAFALLPFFYIISLGERKTRNILALVLLALPFIPLYFVAVDWGRWISFHIFSASTILSSAAAKGHFRIQRNPSYFYIFPLVVLALLASPNHIIGVIWGGAAKQAELEFSRFFD